VDSFRRDAGEKSKEHSRVRSLVTIEALGVAFASG